MQSQTKVAWDKDQQSNSFLRATVDELLRLKTLSLELQAELELNMSNTALEPKTIEKIQSLDYLTQSLTALSDIWSEVVNQDGIDFRIEHPIALETVSLRDLKDRLKGSIPGPIQDVSPGRCQLF